MSLGPDPFGVAWTRKTREPDQFTPSRAEGADWLTSYYGKLFPDPQAWAEQFAATPVTGQERVVPAGEPLTLQGIADLLSQLPKPVERALHAHPDVVNWLRLTTPEAKPEFPGTVGALTGIPIFEEPEFSDGHWELREDGLVVSSGDIEVPYLARRIKIEFREPPPFRMWWRR